MNGDVVGVLGASGGTGSVVVRQLLDAGTPVRAAVRSSEAARRLEAAGARTVTLDLATAPAGELEAAFTGLGAIVNAAAARSTVSSRAAKRIDRDGVARAVAAAEEAGVRRWVQISMMGSDNPTVVPFFLRRIAAVKGQADAIVTGSGLVWTVLRPPWLTDGPPTGRVTVARNLEGGSIAREDVAAVAISCLAGSPTEHRVFDVASGATPLSEALASVAALA